MRFERDLRWRKSVKVGVGVSGRRAQVGGRDGAMADRPGNQPLTVAECVRGWSHSPDVVRGGREEC